MPYIDKAAHKKLDPLINTLATEISTIGSLNYCITKLCLNFLKRSIISYTALNEIPGVLECAKLEFYRKVLAKYEDKKCQENGEVYIK